jgi:hypothetical protein
MSTIDKIVGQLGYILALFGGLLFVFCIHQLMKWGEQRFRGIRYPTAIVEGELSASFSQPSQFSYVGYSRALISMFLLLFQSLTNTTLALLDCESIQGELRLYQDASVVCYKGWQYPLFIFLFILVTFPFLLIPLRWYLARHIQNEHARVVLQVLELSYKPKRNWWETVSLLRRLVLLCFAVFIRSPIWRAHSLTFGCIIFLFAHIFFKPIRDKQGQMLESVLLTCLTAIAVLQIPAGVYFETGIKPINDDITNLFEIFLIVVPLLTVLVLFARVLWLQAKKMRRSKSKKKYPLSLKEERRALIDSLLTNESNDRMDFRR